MGLQIIGPEGEDPTTIEFARLLAAEIGGFVPPPGLPWCGRDQVRGNRRRALQHQG